MEQRQFIAAEKASNGLAALLYIFKGINHLSYSIMQNLCWPEWTLERDKLSKKVLKVFKIIL